MPPRKATTTKKAAPKKAVAKPAEPAEGTVKPADNVSEVGLPPEEKQTKSISDVAKEVIAGDWGIGQDRRLRLSNAGYNVEEVKAEVTRQLNTRT